MKKALFITAAFLFCSFAIIANNGNNNENNNNTSSNEIKLVKSDAAPDPYNTNIESPIPGCHGPKQPDRVCTREYAPVCGCDGKTYGNACTAIKEGILIFVPGECGSPVTLSCFDPAQVDPSGACPAVYAPVCACGVLTFSNACFAQKAGFINTTEGACVTGQ